MLNEVLVQFEHTILVKGVVVLQGELHEGLQHEFYRLEANVLCEMGLFTQQQLDNIHDGIGEGYLHFLLLFGVAGLALQIASVPQDHIEYFHVHAEHTDDLYPFPIITPFLILLVASQKIEGVLEVGNEAIHEGQQMLFKDRNELVTLEIDGQQFEEDSDQF
jgi:hypothetical protein